MTCDVATNFAIRKVEASRPHIAMRMIGLSVPARKAAHEPEEDMRLRVMALAASVLATVAVSTVSKMDHFGLKTYSMLPHRQSAKTDLPSWLRELEDSWQTERPPREFSKATEG
jgi:hypothetical protein